ncbi:Aromatic-ring-hydroxylating dioxygenase alpha subunit [Penicillium odoratum]|uniref:Aromatic-ring-hydroxylating dioxygenase alpha subunit n=1 Tax=Penicillium odoratum TaxID=1167516 RepID=UPI002546A706|nr:Aromatic-ring-hydroxylating dioxygenase alpha subunit [Penicillium odoratum]KAJ5768972.1 Aromatic-ring-hydroxylating dioxygenase alpha subunit [Penicillium odoratum]
MDFLHAYLLSPGSILVAVVTVFLVNRALTRVPGKKTGVTSDSNGYSSIEVSKEPDLPEGWYHSLEVFELERRALFSKSWVYLAHITQFAKPGAYQSFDIAGFPVFLIRGKDDKIRAFHNVCRHRAYTITRKEAGASTVLGCRYHGWSYDTCGQLVKAPQFDDVPGFEKSENSLFEIHAHTTKEGCVLVNLDAGEPCPMEPALSVLDNFVRATSLGNSEWVLGKTLTGSFNWKLGTSGPGLASFTKQLEQRISEALKPSLTTRMLRAVMPITHKARCTLFPGTFLYSFEQADIWLALNFLPSSEKSTRIRYDLFASTPKPSMNETAFANSVEEVIQSLIKSIENDYQCATERSAESSETTHRILKHLHEHQKLERVGGGLVRPAMRQPKGSSLFQQAEQLCKELDCLPGSQSGSVSSNRLDW